MNKYVKLSIGAFAGAALGFGYYYFIGCGTGSCPITSNWNISTIYGAAIGIALAFPTQKKNKNDE